MNDDPRAEANLNTCPICDRTWEITRSDDCLVPACGCYGVDPWTGAAPCESCGIAHAWSCPVWQAMRGFIVRGGTP